MGPGSWEPGVHYCSSWNPTRASGLPNARPGVSFLPRCETRVSLRQVITALSLQTTAILALGHRVKWVTGDDSNPKPCPREVLPHQQMTPPPLPSPRWAFLPPIYHEEQGTGNRKLRQIHRGLRRPPCLPELQAVHRGGYKPLGQRSTHSGRERNSGNREVHSLECTHTANGREGVKLFRLLPTKDSVKDPPT